MITNFNERQAAVKSAQGIVGAAIAERREINETEQQIIDNTLAEVKAYDEQQERRQRGSSLLKEIGGGKSHEMTRHSTGEYSSNLGGYSEDVEYLDLGSKSHGKSLVKAMQATRPMGSKSLASSGGVVVGIPLISSTPTLANQPLLSFLQAIPTVRREPVYAWLQAGTRVGGAEVVPSGSLKPTLGLTLTKRENRLSVIATLSEPIDKFILEDNLALEGWVNQQLTLSVMMALEDQILLGDGEGDNFLGLVNISGIQTLASSAGNTDKLVEMRKALTKLETAGEKPSMFILSPSDWEAITTKRNVNGSFDMGGAINSETRKAWGVPVALSASLTANTYFLMGEDSASIGRGDDLLTEWDKSQGFKTNEVIARTEGRFSLDVTRPTAILKGTFATV